MKPGIAILLVAAVLNLAFLCRQTFNPQDNDMPESAIIHSAERFARGDSLYQNYHFPPYNITPYTPGHYFLLAMIHKRTGSREQTILMGRWLTLVLTLLIAFLLLRSASYVSALLFLSSYILWPVAVTNRPDVPAVFFALSGMLLWIKGRERISIVFFVLAFLTKQSMVAAPLSIVLFYFLRKQWRKGMVFGVSVGVPFLLLLMLLHAITDGLSTDNLVAANAAPYSFRIIQRLLMLFLQTTPLLLILAILACTGISPKEIQPLYFLVSLTMAVLMSGKLGSSLNYYLETVVAASLIAPLAVQWYRVPFSVAAFVLLIPFCTLQFSNITRIQFRNDARIRHLISQQSSVISDNPRLAVQAKEPLLIDPFNLAYLERKGQWNPAPLILALNKGDIPLVVLTNPIQNPITWQGQTRLPASVIRAIKENYWLTERVDDYYIYRKRPQGKIP